MRLLVLASLLLAPLVLADVGFRQGSTVIGPIRDLSCKADAGLICTRDGGSPVGGIACVGATATEPGCITPSAQTLAGNKTWTGTQRIVGSVHGSLVACSSGLKGTWQTCTTHSSPVFCDGTTNIELTGSTSLTMLPPFNINGLFHSGLFAVGTFTLPFSFAITQTSGFISAGSGSGSVTLRYSDGVSSCDCAVDCDTEQSSVSCSGSCSFAANTLVVALITSDSCTTPPTVKGLLTPAGYKL